MSLAMPHEDYTWLVDLDEDGKQDVLLHHASAAGRQRVELLIAR